VKRGETWKGMNSFEDAKRLPPMGTMEKERRAVVKLLIRKKKGRVGVINSKVFSRWGVLGREGVKGSGCPKPWLLSRWGESV